MRFLGLLVLAAVLAGCGTAASVAHPRASAHPAICTTPKATPTAPSMQLPARTSVGAGTLATAWATNILAALGAPVNAANNASMIAWFAHEDDRKPAGQLTYGAGENNPLNLAATSGDTVGPGHPGNLDFRSPDYGVAATVQVIETRYPAIAAALTSGKGLIGNKAVAAELSEWSGGGYASLG